MSGPAFFVGRIANPSRRLPGRIGNPSYTIGRALMTAMQGLFNRRDFRRAGGGLAVAASGAWTSGARADAGRARAKSCILVYLLGGPPQLDTFDLKPDAPVEMRGPFRPCATR